MIYTDIRLGFNALLLVLRNIRLGDISRLSAHGVVPERESGKAKEDDQSWNNLALVVHYLNP